MELGIFIIAVVLGLFIYFYFKNKKASKLSESNYYYKRFLRNKQQTERNICDLQNIVQMVNNDEKMHQNGVITNLKKYIEDLQSYYNVEYSPKILKKLKRKQLNYKEKKRFAKILVNQSEKLYNVEVEIAQFNEICKKVNYISV